MNKQNLSLTLSLTLIIFQVFLSGCANTTSEESIEIENELIAKTFSFNKTNPGGIFVKYEFKNNPLNSLTTNKAPYFEFVINHQLISSNDRLWVFKNNSIREMGNGGKEHTLTFTGKGKQIDGLEVTIQQQIFPNSTLVRERLMLSSSAEKDFQLNKLDGELHFKFPQYSILSDGVNYKATEIKLASWELKPITFNKSGEQEKFNHMYYPNIQTTDIDDTSTKTVKGPINIVSNDQLSWLTAYEHASQDNINGLLKKNKSSEKNIVDAMQGTSGVFNFPISDEDFNFLGIEYKKEKEYVDISVQMLRGGYLEGEKIGKDNPYSTVWNATAFYAGNDINEGKKIIRNYLFNEICENKASRHPEFYYNTWGMQREISKSKNDNDLLRGIFTYDRIFKEIDYAAQLGVDIFVLDDGWEQTQGIWRANKERLPDGLAPIKERLDKYGIKMGIWLSPMGIDSTTERYKNHPEWVIKDSEGNPIKAQWNHPAFDFVSGFFDVFIEDCKRLIDEGALFFKWDAINTFYSSLPNLDHGSEEYSNKELRERYEYLLPIYVTKAMEILTDYEPELIIEIDLTEARRVMMGLAPLSHGKLFFMNNGASWYNDYTSFRTMSMRTIPNEYNGLIPLELFTYATYPQNIENCMQYNVNTSLIAGHGFWGNLELMPEQERLSVGKKVEKSKRILPFISQTETIVEGNVGDSPEIYIQVNSQESAGQIFVFTNEEVEVSKKIEVNGSKFLAVLNQPYSITEDLIELNFKLKGGNASAKEAFIIPNNNSGISIISSTCVLDNAFVDGNNLEYSATEKGMQVIMWDKKNGEPKVLAANGVKHSIEDSGDFKKLIIETAVKTTIKIQAMK